MADSINRFYYSKPPDTVYGTPELQRYLIAFEPPTFALDQRGRRG